jgi:hypothetical protein
MAVEMVAKAGDVDLPVLPAAVEVLVDIRVTAEPVVAYRLTHRRVLAAEVEVAALVAPLTQLVLVVV